MTAVSVVRLRQVGLTAATFLVVVAGVFAGWTDSWWWGLGWLAFPIVGVLILLKRPGNTIGRLLWITGAGWTFSWIGYQLDGPPIGQSPAWLELVASLGGYLAWLSLIAIIALFPSGRAESRSNRVLVGLIGLTALLILLAVVLSPEPLEGSGRANPVGLESLGDVTGAFIDQGFVIVPILMVASLAGLIVRWRRSSGPERLQYQWLGASVAFAAVIVSSSMFLGDSGEATSQGVPIFALFFVVGLNAVPVAIGIAVLRYHLYDISLVVSRTISYLVMTLALVAVYAGIVTSVTRLIPDASSLAVASATLVAAAVFRPLLRRIQH
ncbi:MAG: hypothetical protein ABI720_01835, partial [Actinomycetes bacterium]